MNAVVCLNESLHGMHVNILVVLRLLPCDRRIKLSTAVKCLSL